MQAPRESTTPAPDQDPQTDATQVASGGGLAVGPRLGVGPRFGLGQMVGLIALVAVALWLRLHGLGERMLSHPENFAPGLGMPDWLSFPPPRDDLVGILKGTLIDGHPPTFFVALWAWTKVFGASLISLRMPAALLGTASVYLVYRVARREAGRGTALLAAALLAFNGHHLYWSQMARMYVPVAFLCLLSTVFLLRMHERRDRVGREQLGYFATTVLALWTQLYAWPFLFAQMVAASARALRTGSAPVALRTQLFAVMVGLPAVQLSIFQNPPSRWHQGASEYFGFGYLFYSNVPFFGNRPDLAWAGTLSVALGVALLILGAFAVRGTSRERAAVSDRPPEAWRRCEWIAALGLTAGLGGFAVYSLHYSGVSHAPIFAVAALPLVAVVMFPVVERSAVSMALRPPRWWPNALGRDLPELPLSVTLAVVPVICMLGVSVFRGAFVARGTVVFQPFLAIAVAQGLSLLVTGGLGPRAASSSSKARRLRPVGVAFLAAVMALHGVSLGYFQLAQSSPRDYRDLAVRIDGQLEPTDRVLVQDDFGYPPFVYYLRHAVDQMVHTNYKRAFYLAPEGTGFWMVHLTEHTVPRGMEQTFEGLEPERAIEAYGIRGLYYRRPRNWPVNAVSCTLDSVQLGPGPGELLEVPEQVQLDNG